MGNDELAARVKTLERLLSVSEANLAECRKSLFFAEEALRREATIALANVKRDRQKEIETISIAGSMDVPETTKPN